MALFVPIPKCVRACLMRWRGGMVAWSQNEVAGLRMLCLCELTRGNVSCLSSVSSAKVHALRVAARVRVASVVTTFRNGCGAMDRWVVATTCRWWPRHRNSAMMTQQPKRPQATDHKPWTLTANWDRGKPGNPNMHSRNVRVGDIAHTDTATTTAAIAAAAAAMSMAHKPCYTLWLQYGGSLNSSVNGSPDGSRWLRLMRAIKEKQHTNSSFPSIYQF